MKVHSLQTVGELISAIKTAARADDLNMMLAFNSEVPNLRVSRYDVM